MTARTAGFDVENEIVAVPNNYPSKGWGERGAFFRDSEGNLLAIGLDAAAPPKRTR